MRKLCGENATIARTLDKVELALRRVAADPTINISDPSTLVRSIADAIAIITRDMYHDRP